MHAAADTIGSRPTSTPRRVLSVLGLAAAMVGAMSNAAPAMGPGVAYDVSVDAPQADLSVLTYNVKGLPWPAASGRGEALRQIGQRLAAMRRARTQPNVVVLQESFTAQAKAVGEIAGYPFRVEGPYARAAPGVPGGRWYRGETQSAMLDSGLTILSDLPVLSVRRAAFPAGDCAGYDCLAAKGVVIATVAVPGRGPVTIAATHLNSRKASGAPFNQANAAYARQVAFLGRLLKAERASETPLVLAGDFNRGDRPTRVAALAALVGSLGKAQEALPALAATGDSEPGRRADLATILRKGRDMQFAFDGSAARIDPVWAEIPFGTEANGTMLSDHLGFVVRYRLLPVADKAGPGPRVR